VERGCRGLLRATRALLSEFKLPLEAWISVLSMVEAGLNNAASVRMQGNFPKEMFLGLPPDSPLVSIKAVTVGDLCGAATQCTGSTPGSGGHAQQSGRPGVEEQATGYC
jgi:hypothetical protein